MSEQQSNPLANFFRQPAIYIKLPSGGKWWKDGSLELTVTGEIGIYPMTTKDEITLKTPDALMNGQGVVDVIQSCVPSIKNAWDMPSIDVDAVLIAIRIASYGENMEFESTCPHCNEENKHEIDLKGPLSGIRSPDYSQTVVYKTLKIKLHPQNYYAVNRSNRVNFEEQKISDALNMGKDVDPEVKVKYLTESMSRLIELGLESITASVEYIEMEDGARIDNKAHIKDFFKNAEASVVRLVQDKLSDLAEQSKIQPAKLQCMECTKPYEVALLFDYSNFFG
jgi:hypothetical protein